MNIVFMILYIAFILIIIGVCYSVNDEPEEWESSGERSHQAFEAESNFIKTKHQDIDRCSYRFNPKSGEWELNKIE